MEKQFIEQLKSESDPGSVLMEMFDEGLITSDEFEWIHAEIFEATLNEALKEPPFPVLPNKLIETDGLLGQTLPIRDNGADMSEWLFLRRFWREIQ